MDDHQNASRTPAPEPIFLKGGPDDPDFRVIDQPTNPPLNPSPVLGDDFPDDFSDHPTHPDNASAEMVKWMEELVNIMDVSYGSWKELAMMAARSGDVKDWSDLVAGTSEMVKAFNIIGPTFVKYLVSMTTPTLVGMLGRLGDSIKDAMAANTPEGIINETGFTKATESGPTSTNPFANSEARTPDHRAGRGGW